MFEDIQSVLVEILTTYRNAAMPKADRIDPSSYLALVREKPLGQKLLKTIRGHETLGIYDGSMINTGHGASRIDAEHLAAWLIRRSFLTSPPTAVADVVDHMDSDHNDARTVLGAIGLKVNNPIPVMEGVELVPTDRFDPQTQAFLNPGRFLPPTLSYDLPRADAAFVKRSRISPKFEPKMGERTTISEDHSVDLRALLVLFGLIDNAAPLPGWSMTLIDDRVPCGDMIGTGGLSEVIEFGMDRSLTAEKSDIELVGRYYPLFDRLPDDRKELYTRAIEKLSLSRRHSRLEDQYLDLGIALEMLLLSDLDENAPVALPFRQRGAWLLGANPEDREELEQIFKHIYSFRSMAVHEGRLKNRKRGKRPAPSDFRGDAIKTGCAVARRLLELGDPDLRPMIYGAEPVPRWVTSP